MMILSPGIASCSPSLALMKYWGKANSSANLPATPSLALTLDTLKTITRVWAVPRSENTPEQQDLVIVNQQIQDIQRFTAFFDTLRHISKRDVVFLAESSNNFPTAAGLASSSSGFAALALAGDQALKAELSTDSLSALARLGSASAARSLYGGYTILPAGASNSTAHLPASHWPDLRVIIVRVKEGAKEISSRSAMELTRNTSPYYQAWVEDAAQQFPKALQALNTKNIEALGHCMQLSYLRMFGSMLAADPPILYWHPDSLGIIRLCADLRQKGIQAWETMDAGPQVKIFCLETQVASISQALEEQFPALGFLIDKAGEGPQLNNHHQSFNAPHQAIAHAASRLGYTLDGSA